MRDQLAIMTALRKEMFRMRLLEIITADFAARNLRRNRKHRNTAAMRVVKPVDEMQIAGPTAAGAHREASGQMRFRTCSERSGLLMPDWYPLDVVARADRIRDSI